MDEEVPCPDPNEPVTRRILQEELSKYATLEQLDARLLESEQRTAARLEAMEARLMAELGRHTRAIKEETLHDVVPMLDPHEGEIRRLKGRVDSLELRMETREAPRRMKRRTRPKKPKSRKRRTR